MWQKIENIRVLNLFAYTGCATMAAASASNVSEVVHVDASKSINDWAKENMHLCNFDDKHIRFIVEDVIKFLKEIGNIFEITSSKIFF